MRYLIIIIVAFLLGCEKEEEEPKEETNITFGFYADNKTYVKYWYETAKDTVRHKQVVGNWSRSFTQNKGKVSLTAHPKNASSADKNKYVHVYLVVDGDTVQKDTTIWAGDDAIVSKHL